MGACQSRDATEQPVSNIQAAPTTENQTVESPASPSANQSATPSGAVVPFVSAYVPPPGAWSPEKAEAQRRAKLAELQRQNELEIARATAHLRYKSQSKDRRSSKHHRPSTSMHVEKTVVDSTTQRPAEIEQSSAEPSSVEPSIVPSKRDAEISIQTGVHASPSRSVTRQLSSPVTGETDALPLSRSERRARSGSHQSVTPSLTRESSRVDSRSTNEPRPAVEKTVRKEWNYDDMPGARSDRARHSSRHSHSHSISHTVSAPSTPPQPRRATFGESTHLKTVTEPVTEETSVSSVASNVDSTPTKPDLTITNPQSPTSFQGVRLRAAPITPKASAAPRVQSVSPTAADASAAFGIKLRKTTPNSPSSSTPITTVTASVV